MCYRIRGSLGNLVLLAINFSSSPSLIIVEKHENFGPIVIDGLAFFVLCGNSFSAALYNCNFSWKTCLTEKKMQYLQFQLLVELYRRISPIFKSPEIVFMDISSKTNYEDHVVTHDSPSQFFTSN